MDQQLQLVFGNRNYSSWSLRAWLALRHSGLPFEEIFIPLGRPESKAAIARHSPSGLVPILKVGSTDDWTNVWESLAIIETLNELAPGAGLWPAGLEARAVARAVSSEMHAGFFSLRRDMPMDMRSDLTGPAHAGRHSEAALADSRRILALWADCRDRFGAAGPYLFGDWCAADMMFAPVVSRFRTYGVPLEGPAADYMQAVWAQSDMAHWTELARAEPFTIPEVR
ncbi:MAG: glutathione S-transferase family protein [Rhodospirillales bacterium]